jgi:hypothetical protein
VEENTLHGVRDEPKDKLPNTETVAFFDGNNFDIFSTNSVYGIKEHFGLPDLSAPAGVR